MKTTLMAGALAFALWGGAAFASDSCVRAQPQTQSDEQALQSPSNSQSQQDSWREGTTADHKTVVGGTYDGDDAHQQGIGPSGSAEVASTSPYSNVPTDQSSSPALALNQCAPAEQGVGGSGSGSVGTQPEYYAAQDPDEGTEVTYEQKPDMNGVTVLLGGGVEGYTGSLAPRIAPGPTYGVSVQFRPSNILGIELGYSGAVSELRDSVTGGTSASSGPDIIRNGGRALATVGLTDTQVQPYVLAGVGIEHFDVRGGASRFGFKSDTAGEIPVGIGFRTQVGAFTADLRGDYSVPFDQDIAPGVETQRTVAGVDTSNAGRYQGELRIGANF